MVFSSSVFLMAFLPLTLLAYFLVPARMVKARNAVLLASSLVFYGWGEPKYIVVMLFSIVFNYVSGRIIGKYTGMNNKHRARPMLVLCVFGNLALLGIFKYTDFVLDTINRLTAAGLTLPGIALPIGISFYTFQTMSYIIDVYRGKVEPQKDLITFGAYVALFPQLIAGPIVRYSDVAVMLAGRRTNLEQAAEGVRRFIIGFGKKVLLANQIYVVWMELSSMENLSVAAAWLGAVAFTFQIYFDFSGYSDMAIGLGKIFGFDYLENFNYPYISRSITEFWRRWHMSLSSWFKEYVYIPLGGNRKGIARQLVNISIVWILTGLWHGASWNFVMWGVYYGIILIVEKLGLLKVLQKCPSVIGHLYSLVLIVIGWVIFAIDDMGAVISYISMMFGSSGCFIDDAFLYFIQSRVWLVIACIIGSTPLPKLVCNAVAQKLADRELLLSVLETALMMGILVLAIAFLVSGSYNPFLYFRF
ncbi:MAG: MBOAT family O-acyltransferase [Anaerovoracaceae bacterium]|nr:MBOAT family protein [Bacillota bacterium]MDY5906234.1 MBOAT family O-acyltransferase [Anaerovoracaceae bacterium]